MDSMKLQMTGQMRFEQRMKLAPHMIQSMEILQLPLLALKDRIEQELNSNPTLESDDGLPPQSASADEPVNTAENPADASSSQTTTAEADTEKDTEFERYTGLDDNVSEYLNQADSFRPRSSAEQADKKLEAIKNTAAPQMSLHDYLDDQWRLVDTPDTVKKAGSIIIDYIDEKGYLSVRPEQLHNEKSDFSPDDINKALALIQKLDPVGVGARDMGECMLIQMANSGEDYSFEEKLVSNYMQDLLENRLPEIAKKMNCSLEQLNHSIERLGRLDISPGLQVGPDQNHPITADVIVEESDQPNGFSVRLADTGLPNLRISDYYVKLAKDPSSNDKTKQFLQNSIRSAQWIIDAIQQRKNTLLRVAQSIVKFQHDFFEKGHLYLKPLPMSKIAEDVGVHLATVSRAVAGKYLFCSQGIIPLRKFFSGGTEDVNGNPQSWQTVRIKLQQIIDSEDKKKPLNDDQIRQKLADAGIPNLARRTVAKYRKLLNIPTARFRKKY
jgi:RNA polymerase sigma-54 factor